MHFAMIFTVVIAIINLHSTVSSDVSIKILYGITSESEKNLLTKHYDYINDRIIYSLPCDSHNHTDVHWHVKILRDDSESSCFIDNKWITSDSNIVKDNYVQSKWVNISLADLDEYHDIGYYYCSGRNSTTKSFNVLHAYFVFVINRPTLQNYLQNIVIYDTISMDKLNLKPTNELISNMTSYEQKWIFLNNDLVTSELLADDILGSRKPNIEYDNCSRSITVIDPIEGFYISIGINFDKKDMYYLYYMLV